MRVIAGKFGSLKLKMVPSKDTRETQDKVRGAVFNSLGSMVVDSRILDLFAGSGAYGFEALSRGASEVYLNDSSSLAVKTIIENAKHLKVLDDVVITQRDYLTYLDELIKREVVFDIVFIDPPYKAGYYDSIFGNILSLLKLNSRLVVEMEKGDTLKFDSSLPIRIYKESIYGSKKITYLKVIDPKSEEPID